ncbi:MAG: hypothetical protein EPN72_12035 [Nevskiaceae bacterium]|nr:MAG: hypothetical protein EPN63_00940 [Nevskiaceae bacterium]TBR71916.1 MAG: hypothetical protein EPN72_12035 [Nevskiaceae bacterium]
MNGLVLSGVPGIVLSGVSLSCYQACQIAGNPMVARVSASSNLPNVKALTFGRHTPSRWTTAARHAPPPQQHSPRVRRAAR